MELSPRNDLLRDVAIVIAMVIIVFMAFALSSCNPCARLARKCPPKVHDSIIYKESIKYRDTTIYVKLPPDTLKIKGETVYNNNGISYMPRIERTYGIISAWAEIRNSKFSMYAYLNDTSWKVELKDALRDRDYYKEHIRTETTQLPPVKYIPGFYNFTFYYFIITGSILLLILAFYIFKKFYLPKL